MKSVLLIITFTVLLSTSKYCYAATDITSGNITNLTSTSSGVMIMLSGTLPDNCQGTPYGWMLIPQEYKAMTAVVLLAYQNKQGIAVYTQPSTSGGFCTINQVNPYY